MRRPRLPSFRLPAAGSTRTIWIIALTAVISLAAGLGLSRMIVSPAEAAADAEPPEAGPITVPVEERVLANDVVLRGDAIYEDPADVTIEAGDLGGPAVVTGQVPEVGATIDAGEVLLEITGRPVILLEGDLPVYRTLRAGVSGPDVAQLKKALGSLGIEVGDGDVYDSSTANGVAALYAEVGYPTPTAGEEAELALDAARDGVNAAEESVADARRELASSSSGTPHSERVRLQAEVNSAQHRLDAARAACDKPTEEQPCDRGAVIDAQGAFDVAIAAREEGQAGPDTSASQGMVDAAVRGLAQAQEDLVAAQQDVITPLPASEVVYLAATPRRVDAVSVKRGATVAGSVMSVSGATLQIEGAVGTADAALIEEDSEATITLPGGEDVTGTVVSVGVDAPSTGASGGEDGESGADSGAAAANRERVVIQPGELTEEQRAELQGSNVRITIGVSSTGGEVLAVPIAALTAGPGGEARVELAVAGQEETVLVEVETGLAAGGFVAVTPIEGELAAGDRVVVGQTQGEAWEPEESDAADEEDAEAEEEDAEPEEATEDEAEG
ncbi:hypothetical protein [Actinotalea sp. C106]|uniref:hypothetical protein n=1 Tax=Actinotalea sp. C106 TaxID=2908644 RepID=UPI0020289120|nr:hypothetical protein [Actinotalea sp. C106]